MKEAWKNNYPKLLLWIYLIIWAILAISPNYRGVWIAENILTVLFIGLLVFSYRKFRFSNFSYTLIFIFMVLHSIGGHYAYNEMPLFDLIQNEFDLSRNHYDRVIHFLFGLLFFVPIYEVITRIFRVPEGWRGLLLTFLVVTSLKGGFEALEYGYLVVTRGGELNELLVTNYLGQQGDAFDAYKDIALGIFGAGIALVLCWVKGLGRNAPTSI